MERNERLIQFLNAWTTGQAQVDAIAEFLTISLKDELKILNEPIASFSFREQYRNTTQGCLVADAIICHTCDCETLPSIGPIRRPVNLCDIVEKRIQIDIVDFTGDGYFGIQGRKLTISKLDYGRMRLVQNLCETGTRPCRNAMQDLMTVYSHLLATPECVQLTCKMRIIDTSDFLQWRRNLSAFDSKLTTRPGQEYTLFCKRFHSTWFRLGNDFTLSLTQNAFNLVITIAGLIMSFAGVIQVVQWFLK